MQFTRHDDGSISVDRFDAEVEFSQSFIDMLRESKSDFVEATDSTVTIRCRNGWAKYWIRSRRTTVVRSVDAEGVESIETGDTTIVAQLVQHIMSEPEEAR